MIKAILYERTVVVCANMDFGKGWEDLSLEVTAGGLGGGRRLWRQESVFKAIRQNLRERSSLREARELRLEWNNMNIDEYGILRVRLCTIWTAPYWTEKRQTKTRFYVPPLWVRHYHPNESLCGPQIQQLPWFTCFRLQRPLTYRHHFCFCNLHFDPMILIY